MDATYFTQTAKMMEYCQHGSTQPVKIQKCAPAPTGNWMCDNSRLWFLSVVISTACLSEQRLATQTKLYEGRNERKKRKKKKKKECK